MKAIIIEDENSAVINLEHLLKSIAPDMVIAAVIDNVSDAITFFEQEKDYDLVFMDIHLADGNSFEILREAEPAAPIIFTTAYDQYALKAFKVNSIDYLLKPIQSDELKTAIEKFKKSVRDISFTNQQIEGVLQLLKQDTQKYRESFLVQKGDKLIPLATASFAFFFIQNGVVRGTTTDAKTYHLDGKLEDLENDLNPEAFYRANRQYLVSRAAIQDLSIYFNGRLIVNTVPAAAEKIIVSKANAPKFKHWLNRR